MAEDSASWYADGLRFACRQCGSCCRIQGYVWVDRRAIRRLARHLDLEDDEFGRRFLRRVGRRYSLVEKPNHECVFWEDGCRVYEARPPQCRTFPFWNRHLESEEDWAEVGAACRGIGQGRTYPAEEIDALRSGTGATDDGGSTDEETQRTGDCDCSGDRE